MLRALTASSYLRASRLQRARRRRSFAAMQMRQCYRSNMLQAPDGGALGERLH